MFHLFYGKNTQKVKPSFQIEGDGYCPRAKQGGDRMLLCQPSPLDKAEPAVSRHMHGHFSAPGHVTNNGHKIEDFAFFHKQPASSFCHQLEFEMIR